MNRNFEDRKSRKVYLKSKENNAIIKALNMYGRVPEQWELLEEIERLNTIINELEKYLIAEIEDYDKSINSKFITDISKEQYEGEKVCFEDMLGRLQELKGSDKE